MVFTKFSFSWTFSLLIANSGGKTSIRKVVFEGMAPSDTLFIEKTAKSMFEDTK